MAITEALRNAQWLCNSDTGHLFPQTGNIAVTGNIGPYWPTDEEMALGQRIPRAAPVIAPSAPAEAPPVITEVVPATLEEAEAQETVFKEPTEAPEVEAPPVKRGPGRPKGVISRSEQE